MTDLHPDEILTFAYGSNMKLSYLREFCPSARAVQGACLPNYRIEFRRFSENLGGGISTIMEWPGSLVQGVLFVVKGAELEALDRLEDIPLGLYQRQTFLVLGRDGLWHRGDLYRVVTAEGPFAPADAYLDMMLEGGAEQGLPEDYLAALAARRGRLEP